ncbi:hypothetical protein LI328DRAFT_127944 [Trichoderma asperelloides]|nr:hypothetical protein LI328DRAFT_127944 [Trichoderma asperelloides]
MQRTRQQLLVGVRPTSRSLVFFFFRLPFLFHYPLLVFASAPDGHKLRLAASSPALHIPEARCLVRNQHLESAAFRRSGGMGVKL